MKLSCVLMAWALSVCPAVLLATQMLLAASSETLKCEGPVSTEQSGCHTDEEEDVIHASEEDFQVKGYKFSKPFHLIVSYDWLILQGPDTSIFEGDPLVLHCRAWQDWPLTQVIFYQEGSALAPPGPKREFSIDVVQKSDSGHYHCSGVFRSPGPGSRETASPVAITVQGPLNSVDSSILNPALQKPTASETPPMEPPGPLRPPPAPSAEHLRVSSSDPHLLHQIQMLLKQMQDVKVLLGHLVVELRELTVYLKPGITKVADK
ncbi:Fc receptor-like A isoform X7 [Cricetulus griseus]|uniref:Fc receptor-like A isoform X7 n=1 Tax=Cricetulus griseus TaxID=10029 RepID=A0A9J7GZT8_CRIGR|nr:Fc receptor-like A isoform X7 [Cricetulus griseus]XP_035314602.1 Fc receptor-like A isoform X7 [Cricetulus griseus]